jgi:hypothetical protein
MAFEKQYVGKGKEVPNYADLVEIVVAADKLQTFYYDNVKYAKMTVAKMRETDKYGKTHTVYQSVKVEKQDVQIDPDAQQTQKDYTTKKPDYPQEDIDPNDIPF